MQIHLPACGTWWRRWRCPGCHNWHTVQVFKVNVIIVRFRFWIPIRGQCQLLSAIPERKQEDKMLGLVFRKFDMSKSILHRMYGSCANKIRGFYFNPLFKSGENLHSRKKLKTSKTTGSIQEWVQFRWSIGWLNSKQFLCSKVCGYINLWS